MDKLSSILTPLALCVLLFEAILFGNWLLIERLHLNTYGGLVAALAWAIYSLALLVLVLLPLAWRGLQRGGQGR